MNMQGTDVFFLAAVVIAALGVFENRHLIWKIWKGISGAIFRFRASLLFREIFEDEIWDEVWSEKVVEIRQKSINERMHLFALELLCSYDDLRKIENLLRKTADPEVLKELLKKWGRFEKKAETLGDRFIQARDIARYNGFEAQDWFTGYLG